MRRHRLLAPLALCALLGLAGAIASAPLATGQIGNLNPPTPPSLPGLVVGEQSFAYLVFPGDLGFPDPGFELEAVHMLLDFTPEQVPASFGMSVGLAAAVWDPSVGKYVPADQVCTSPVIIETVDAAGPYEAVVALNGACGCRPMNDVYFLIVRFPDPFAADLPVDNDPQPGVVYVDDGGGWVDMFGLKRTAPGKGIIWGDIVTCNPISAVSPTWGTVKGLYR